VNARIASLFRRTERFHCPRRVENDNLPGSPFWTARNDKPQDTFEGGRGLIGQSRGCSYCGSLPGDDFMELVRAGALLSSTYKDYKVYVDAPVSAKFYFQHLTIEQRVEFVDLYRTRKVAFSPHDGFQVLPFFMKRGGAA